MTEPTKKVKFPPKIRTLHIPFMAELGSYDQLRREIDRIDCPKGTRRIEASITLSIDLTKNKLNYSLAQVTLHR